MPPTHGVPVVETIAGKGGMTHYNPVHAGPIGVIGSTSANTLAGEADVVLAIGTRLQDFTTGSWTAFSPEAKFIAINAARFDATKHRALSVVGDALESVRELDAALGDWKAPGAHLEHAQALFREWDELLDSLQAPTNAPVPTYAQVVAAVNKAAGENDHLIAAAGGLPGEVAKGWRIKTPHTLRSGIRVFVHGLRSWRQDGATPWPARARRTPMVMVGDGSYLMMNSDIYSSVLTGHKMIVVICDNGGFAVINRLQDLQGRARASTI